MTIDLFYYIFSWISQPSTIINIFHFVLTGEVRPLTKYPAGGHHATQNLTTTGQLILGLFLYSTLIVLGTIFFAITLQKLDNIYFFELYSKLFLKIQNSIDLQLSVFYKNPSKKTILNFFINDVSGISRSDYDYIWYLFNVKLNLPLPAVEPAAELYINYFFVNTYILFLIILLFLLYWFFCGRTATPTVLKSTYVLSHKRSSKTKYFLYKNFTRSMHSSSAGRGNIDNFIIAYNHIVRDLQADPNLLNTVTWIMNTLKLDINDIGNTMYIKRIMSMVGTVSPYDIIISISKLIAERSRLDLSTALAPLRDLQLHIGLLTDAIKIKPETLYIPEVQTGCGRVVNLTETLTNVRSPKVNHSALVPGPHSIKVPAASPISNQLLVESTDVLSKNDLFFCLFKVLIISGVCVGLYFIFKNLLISNSVKTYNIETTIDTISSDFVSNDLALNYHVFYFTILILLLLILINICIIKILRRFKS